MGLRELQLPGNLKDDSNSIHLEEAGTTSNPFEVSQGQMNIRR
jgi:hypothetical protein